MNDRSEAAIREVLRKRLEPRLAANGLSQSDVGDRTSLTQSGVLDSFGLMEWLAEVEAELGMELDFGDLAPEQLTTLAGLSTAFAQQARP